MGQQEQVQVQVQEPVPEQRDVVQAQRQEVQQALERLDVEQVLGQLLATDQHRIRELRWLGSKSQYASTDQMGP